MPLKALPSEHGNLVHMPCWDGSADDPLISALVDLLLRHLGNLGPAGDVRCGAAHAQTSLDYIMMPAVGRMAKLLHPRW